MNPTPTQVCLVVEPIDMRAGIDGLSQRIKNTLGRSPCDGTAYAFRNRRQNRPKLLIWDGTGVWLCQRRLHHGHFTWPKVGATISEQLDVEPAHFFVHRHIRRQYACRACETVSAVPIPPAVIDGEMAAPGLLTWVMVSKFMDHLPLYRLEQIAARSQVPLLPDRACAVPDRASCFGHHDLLADAFCSQCSHADD